MEYIIIAVFVLQILKLRKEDRYTLQEREKIDIKLLPLISLVKNRPSCNKVDTAAPSECFQLCEKRLADDTYYCKYNCWQV